jgi:hypothetical protein
VLRLLDEGAGRIRSQRWFVFAGHLSEDVGAHAGGRERELLSVVGESAHREQSGADLGEAGHGLADALGDVAAGERCSVAGEVGDGDGDGDGDEVSRSARLACAQWSRWTVRSSRRGAAGSALRTASRLIVLAP